ncbi:hypothetical protein [Streptomyces noursei]|uniref:hypothetical protein n=1 Tax=Streptomyces noursei TaxID=1971 RepID=UPI001679E004|nr:hypothetical protein [Streptomyces noursei]MCZ1021419.1 hypothetical protein [Streptomyces noursei]GGX46330.1 hypothetical protein GCM10010341_80060 [Streptomyces noursei]
MQSFSVYVEFDAADVSPDTYAVLFDALQDQHGAVGPAASGNLSVRLTIQANNITQAATLGIECAQAAAISTGIAPDAVAGIEVITEAELDSRLTDEQQDEELRTTSAGNRVAPRAFSVYVEFDTADASPDTYADLFDALRDVDGAAGPAPNGNVSMRLTIQADSVMQAASLGTERAQADAITHGVSPDTVIGIEVITEGERDRCNALEDAPSLHRHDRGD